MWRTRRSLSEKSMGRRPAAARGNEGTVNTPRRSSGASGASFMVRSSGPILLGQGMVGGKVGARPRAPGRPLRGRIGPEGMMGGKAEGQERDRAQIEAARADVRLGEMRLMGRQADPQPAVL